MRPLPILPLRVCLVDDDLSLHCLMADLLKYSQLPLELSCFENGNVALESAPEWPPLLYIIDDMMPGMKTEEVIGGLRKRYGHTCGIIYYGGMVRMEWTLAMLKIGIDGVWRKPFSPHEFLLDINVLVCYYFLCQDMYLMQYPGLFLSVDELATTDLIRHIHPREKEALAGEIFDRYVANHRLIPRVGLSSFLTMLTGQQVIKMRETAGDLFSRQVLTHHFVLKKNPKYHPIWGERIIWPATNDMEESS